MTVRVTTRNGRAFTLADTFKSKDDVLAVISDAVSGSLVGSMSAGVDVWLDTDDGGAIRYSSIDTMEEHPDGF
jgi:hypothetical protein